MVNGDRGVIGQRVPNRVVYPQVSPSTGADDATLLRHKMAGKRARGMRLSLFLAVLLLAQVSIIRLSLFQNF